MILDKIAAALRQHGVQVPIPDFVREVSNIYHGFEATIYDSSQVSLRDSELSWLQALASIQSGAGTAIRLLDYGAGTGFATLQVLNSPLGQSIQEVVCYDLSSAMMNICREKMRSFKDVSFTFLSDTEGHQALEAQAPFDLVVTNALLHHLLNVEEFLKNVRQWVAPEGYYIAGHEPNYNFYFNPQLVKSTLQFQRYKRVRQRLTLKYWLHKTGVRKSFQDLVSLTNERLMKQNLILKPIPRNLLHKLVDIHVPFGISKDQPWGEIGFKESRIETWLGNDFELKGMYTYSHIKDGLSDADWLWRGRLQLLRKMYPNDGADALMVFKRKY